MLEHKQKIEKGQVYTWAQASLNPSYVEYEITFIPLKYFYR